MQCDQKLVNAFLYEGLTFFPIGNTAPIKLRFYAWHC